LKNFDRAQATFFSVFIDIAEMELNFVAIVIPVIGSEDERRARRRGNTLAVGENIKIVFRWQTPSPFKNTTSVRYLARHLADQANELVQGSESLIRRSNAQQTLKESFCA